MPLCRDLRAHCLEVVIAWKRLFARAVRAAAAFLHSAADLRQVGVPKFAAPENRQTAFWRDHIRPQREIFRGIPFRRKIRAEGLQVIISRQDALPCAIRAAYGPRVDLVLDQRLPAMSFFTAPPVAPQAAGTSLLRCAAVLLCIPLGGNRRKAACPIVYAKNGCSADAAPPDLFNGRTQIPDSVEMFLFISFQGLSYFIMFSFADTRCRTAMLRSYTELFRNSLLSCTIRAARWTCTRAGTDHGVPLMPPMAEPPDPPMASACYVCRLESTVENWMPLLCDLRAECLEVVKARQDLSACAVWTAMPVHSSVANSALIRMPQPAAPKSGLIASRRDLVWS